MAFKIFVFSPWAQTVAYAQLTWLHSINLIATGVYLRIQRLSRQSISLSPLVPGLSNERYPDPGTCFVRSIVVSEKLNKMLLLACLN